MAEDMASTLVAALALTEDAVVDFGEVGSAEVTEEFFYLVGRLVQRKVGDEKGLPSTLLAIWGLGDHSAILVVGEGRFLFHFQCCDECNKILLGEPWFFNRHMLVLGESDPIRLITANYGLGDLGRFNANLCRRLLFSVDPFQSIDLRALNDTACRVSSTDLDLPISFGALKIVGSCNGLICLLKNLSLVIFCNPSTSVTRLLLMPNHSHLGIVMFYGFGYDSTIDDCKVVFGCKGERNGTLATAVVMFQLKTGSWRTIDGLDYVNLNGQVPSARIVPFDSAEETFQELIPLSYSRDGRYISARIGIAENGLFVYIYNSSEITMWAMKESWTKVMQIRTGIHQLPQGDRYSFSNPICILENGEVLMNQDGTYLVLYNPNGGACVNVLETPADLALEPAVFVKSYGEFSFAV